MVQSPQGDLPRVQGQSGLVIWFHTSLESQGEVLIAAEDVTD